VLAKSDSPLGLLGSLKATSDVNDVTAKLSLGWATVHVPEGIIGGWIMSIAMWLPAKNTTIKCIHAWYSTLVQQEEYACMCTPVRSRLSLLSRISS
jgi:cytochrome c oxidase assembly factor CtaG